MGDFNSDVLSPQLPECRLFKRFISNFDLQDMFTGPTWVTESSSLYLDVFLTNCSYSFTDVTALPVGFSDYHIVIGTYLTRHSHQPTGHTLIYVRSYQKLDPTLLHANYTDEVWNDVFSFDNVSDTVKCFTAVQQELMELLVPLCRVRVKRHVSPWAADSAVFAAHHERDEAYRWALSTADPVAWHQYRSACNKANKLLKRAKYTYLSRLTSSTSGKCSKFWSHFRYMSCQGSQPSGSLANIDFTPDDLNCHFLSIADKLAEVLPLTSVSPVSFCSLALSVFHLSKVSEPKVISIINGLESKKATGFDGIPVRFIKAEPSSIGSLFTRLVNFSMKSVIFSDLWKFAVVTQIQKTKKSTELTNFHPISVLPVLSKVLERVVYDQLISYLLQHNLLMSDSLDFVHITQHKMFSYMLWILGVEL